MRAILASILFVAAATACTTTDSITDLGEYSPDTKADVQSIKVPLKLLGGESAEFALTVDGPFQAKAVYAGAATVSIVSGMSSKIGVQPVLVIDAGRTPTEYILKVTNTSSTTVSGTFEIGPAAGSSSCSDQVWIGWFNTLVTKIDAAGSFIDATERSGINTVIAGRPCESTTDGAYVRWHQVFDAKLVAGGSFIDADEKIINDLIKAQRPAAEGEGAYLAWMPKFAAYLTAAGSFIDADERIQLDMRLAVRPVATTDAGYVAWADKLRPMLSAAGSFIDSDETIGMMTLIKGKPCAMTSAESQAAWNALAAAATGEAAMILEAAKPAAGCR
jgi:hypothetical protein